MIAAGGAVSIKGRVLLLEDDASFRGIIRDFLAENGYEVVEAQNGGEGVREALASDFAMVLCDFMMPGLPGDMFYRAVEKIRPDLCKGFVFMTGFQNDARTNEFIKSVNGFVLRKPFQLNYLLDSISLAEVRRSYQSVCYDDCTEADARRRSRKENRILTSRTPPPQPAAVRIPAVQPATVSPAVVEREGKRERPAIGTSVWAALVMAFAAVPVGRYLEMRTLSEASSVELLGCEQQWAITSAALEKAEGKRRGIETAVNRAKYIAEQYDALVLEQVLRSVATAAIPKVEMRDIQVRGNADAPGAFTLRLAGFCTGTDPRAMADAFRKALDVKLKQSFANEGVTTRFERLDDVLPSATEPSGQRDREAAFTLITAAGADRLELMERKDKR